MSAGTFIYQGFKPTLKLLFTIGCGYLISKKGLFPPAASKASGVLCMTIALPCLLFSSMLSSFNSDNISNFGPLAMIAMLLQLMGCVQGLIIREIFYVPKDFQYGILVLCTLCNWGNLPTAIVQSVALQKPFNPDTDVDLGVAYVSIFVFFSQLLMYGTGLYNVLGWDLRDGVEETPRTFKGRLARRSRQIKQLFRRGKKFQSAQETELPVSEHGLPEATVDEDMIDKAPLSTNLPTVVTPKPAAVPEPVHSTARRLFPALIMSLRRMIQPVTIAMLVSIPFSIIEPLKSLIYPTPGWSGTRMVNAPDGQPPLNFIYDFTRFVGALSVPTSLVLLGVSFARLKFSKERIKRMPLAAIAASTFGKLVLQPIFGMLLITGLRQHTSLFPREQKMLSFVALVSSGSASSVNQLVATSMFLRDGQTLDTLAMFLVAQYASLALTSSAVTAVSLWLVS